MTVNYQSANTDLDSILLPRSYTLFGNTATPPAYIWGCGDNSSYNPLTTSGGTYTSSPIQAGTSLDWADISISFNKSLYGLSRNGTLWACGINTFGELGLGDRTTRSVITQIGTLTTWSSISAGYQHVLAVKTDGTLWAWGYNFLHGQLGLGNTTSYSSPVQVGSLTTWSSVSAGYQFSLAVKTDGTLWAWGYNSNGQLGLGDITHRSSPVQVGALTTWASVSAGYQFTLAIKTDGTLWAWGYNQFGGLGLNDITSYSSPVQVGSLTTWSSVSNGTYNSLAIKTDGTLWAWGYNTYGTLGQGNITYYSSPVQVGALTNWSRISLIGDSFFAIKTDGTLWAWGRNGDDTSWGTLGLSNLISYSSPVQVGVLTTWYKIAKSTDTSTTVFSAFLKKLY